MLFFQILEKSFRSFCNSRSPAERLPRLQDGVKLRHQPKSRAMQGELNFKEFKTILRSVIGNQEGERQLETLFTKVRFFFALL